MLARSAEALFWTGRYVERADDSAAVLSTALHEVLAAGSSGWEGPGRSLLAVLGDAPPGQDARALAASLALDERLPQSVAASLSQARDLARGAREVVSVAMWECLNVTANALPARRRESRRNGPHAYLSWVQNQAATFAGLADSTMTRDDGWRFLVLGRAVERADMVLRLLLSRAVGGPAVPGWSTVLRCVGGHDAFLRASHGATDDLSVVRFLTVDGTFPRSLVHALRTAEESLSRLAWAQREPGAVGAAPSGTRRMEAARLAGRARSEVEFTDPAGLLTDLPGRLGALQRQVAEVAEAVAVQYFDVGPWITWRSADAAGAVGTGAGAPGPAVVPVAAGAPG